MSEKEKLLRVLKWILIIGISFLIFWKVGTTIQQRLMINKAMKELSEIL